MSDVIPKWTHFVALNVEKTSLHHVLMAKQREIIRKIPELVEYKVPPTRLHLTIAVARAGNVPEYKMVEAVRRTCVNLDMGDLLVLSSGGLNRFNDTVLVETLRSERGRLFHLHNSIMNSLQEVGCVTEKAKYRSHITLFRTSDAQGRSLNESIVLPPQQFDQQFRRYNGQASISLMRMGKLEPGTPRKIWCSTEEAESGNNEPRDDNTMN